MNDGARQIFCVADDLPMTIWLNSHAGCLFGNSPVSGNAYCIEMI